MSEPAPPASSGFEADPGPLRAPGPTQLILNLDGYEGPLDLLLNLARQQKVDLTHISILALVEQFLAFIESAKRVDMNVAADYLVMAAWLAYLKSRLLLPAAPGEDEPSAGEMAAALAHQLRRLDGMREAGARLMARPLLGQERFVRGRPKPTPVQRTNVYELSLYDLLKTYAGHEAHRQVSRMRVAPSEFHSLEEAYHRLARQLGEMPDWSLLMRFLPEGLSPGIGQRSAVAATFAASLELARLGKLRLRQLEPFGPIYVRAGEAP